MFVSGPIVFHSWLQTVHATMRQSLFSSNIMYGVSEHHTSGLKLGVKQLFLLAYLVHLSLTAESWPYLLVPGAVEGNSRALNFPSLVRKGAQKNTKYPCFTYIVTWWQQEVTLLPNVTSASSYYTCRSRLVAQSRVQHDSKQTFLRQLNKTDSRTNSKRFVPEAWIWLGSKP